MQVRGFPSVLGVTLILSIGGLRAEETTQAPVGDSTPQEALTLESAPTIQEIESTNLDADFSPGEATTNTPAELDEIYAPQEGYLEETGFRTPLRYLIDPLEEWYQKTGLRIGMAHTMLFLQPLGGQSWRYGAAGDLDFMSSWTLLGRGTADTGRFVFTGEYRYKLGAQPASVVGGQAGTLVNPTNAFNDRGWVVRDAYWVQRLFDARVRILIGRADPSDYVGAHWLQNVNNSFINRSFSANPAVPFPGHGPMLGISLRPTDQFYLTAGASNAYSTTIRNETESLFQEWDLFSFGEVGYTPTFENLGAGRYAFGIWHMDARSIGNLPRDWGFTLIVDQNLTENLQVFSRYSYSDGALTNLKHSAQLGFGYSGLMGRSDDLSGLAASLNIPERISSRNETVLELFHRFQVSANNQLSLGFQVIANPGNAVENDPTGMFYMRLRSSF